MDRTQTWLARREARHGSITTARRITRWLDRLHLDPILGFLIPGAGDLMTGAAGVYLVALAVRVKAPRVVVARMLINLSIDIAIGIIPIVGDLFDFVWRANQRNLALLEKRARMPHPRGTVWDWLYVIAAALIFLCVLALPVVLVIWAFRRYFY